ncbi:MULTISPECIES: hypothetical protein [Rhizobium]|uniref:hypothetical protein n=1 Tax=Rhizobium TaxID=379 RepID=UPI0014425BF8|nr:MULTISPECIES: hypothetical protein [Rhizobium]MBY5565357.1 hypothetical protein [Rhizobium leguminosarum]NKN16297.1 hypothetical protein [Rhizobium laguerreae]
MNYMLISIIHKETDCRQVNIHPSHRAASIQWLPTLASIAWSRRRSRLKKLSHDFIRGRIEDDLAAYRIPHIAGYVRRRYYHARDVHEQIPSLITAFGFVHSCRIASIRSAGIDPSCRELRPSL